MTADPHSSTTRKTHPPTHMKTPMPNKSALAATAALTLAAIQIITPAVCAGERSPVDSKKTVIPPEPANPWQVKLAIPGWLAATSGTIGTDGINSNVYLGADTLIRHLDMIATVSAEVRKGRFGMYGDFLYVSASDGVGTDGLIQKLDVRLDQYLVDLELNYRVLEGPRGFLDVRGGVRYTNTYNKLTITPDNNAIDEASVKFVDDVSQQVKERLAAVDIRSKLKTVLAERIRQGITDRLPLKGEHAVLPIAPLGGRTPGRLDEVIRLKVERKEQELADAIRDELEAKTAAIRAAAQQKLASLKSKLAKEIASTLNSTLDQTVSLTEYWFDPYVGLRGRYDLSKAWYLTAKGDIGGFGVGSKLTWQLSGALGCQVTRSIFVEAGYRYLYTDYNQNNFVYNVTQSGAEITTGITF